MDSFLFSYEQQQLQQRVEWNNPYGVSTTTVTWALPSGAYEFLSSIGIQKRKNEVRLFMSMMDRCSSSLKRRKTSSYDHGAISFNDHEDLIWEILFRLPPKHVLRFKCVSKRWYSIISNPGFLRNHSIQYHTHFLQPSHEFLLLPPDHKKKVLLLNLLDHDSPDQPLADLSVLPVTQVPIAEGPDFVFVDSCNGLVLYADAHYGKGVRDRCCRSRRLSKDDDDDLYYLCNPVTKDYIKLPNLKHALVFKEEDENKTVAYTNMDTRIFFDPSVSLSYKVMRAVSRSVLHPPSVSQYQFYIYTSESGSWTLSTSIAGGVYINTHKNVFLNGVMYWMTVETDLLCFDAEKKSAWFQPLPLKPKPKFERRPFYFGKCGGRLCLIEKYSRTYGGERYLNLYDGFDILEMTPKDARWTKKYHVNLGVNVNHHHLIAADIKILHIYKTRNQFKEEEEALLMKIDGRIVSFSLKSNTFFEKELTIPISKQPYGDGDIFPTFLTFVPL